MFIKLVFIILFFASEASEKLQMPTYTLPLATCGPGGALATA